MIQTLRNVLVGLLIVALVLPTAPPALAGDGTCERDGLARCIDGPATRIINGLAVTRPCWRYEAQYACLVGTDKDDCPDLIARGCTNVGTSCLSYTRERPSRCQIYEQTYRCEVSPPGTTTQLNCSGQRYCADGSCFDTGYPPDQDFAKTVTAMEAGREAANYLDCSGAGTCRVFRGFDNRCSVKLFGLSSCCTPNPSAGGTSNFQVLGAALNVGKEVADVGSKYLFDSLFSGDAPGWLTKGLKSMVGFDGVFNPTISFYGFSVYGAAPEIIPAGSTVLVESGNFMIAFDPWSFVIAVIIYVVMSMMACSQEEQMIAMKKGQHLCYNVGSYCSKKAFGICMTKKETNCCFNSRLSRIINEQGRSQVGRGWGSPENPDCRGFTVDQLQALDFSRMDLTEFYAEIAPTMPDLSRITTRANTAVRGAIP